MRHCIRERALQELLVCNPSCKRRIAKVIVQRSDGGVESVDLVVERRHSCRPKYATMHEGARVPDHARHVKQELMRRSHIRTSTKIREPLTCPAQRLLCPICQRRQKMPQQQSGDPLVHTHRHPPIAASCSRRTRIARSTSRRCVRKDRATMRSVNFPSSIVDERNTRPSRCVPSMMR